MKVDLSIDFDFFIKEDIMWDFGHKESMFFLNFDPLWAIRYSEHDLVKETDIKTFADFNPMDIKAKLEEKGFKITRATECFISESHAGIVALEKNSSEMIINIDAHHDMFGEAKADGVLVNGYKVDCGNWLNYFHDKGFYKNALIVYPKWKDIELDVDGDKKIPYPIVKWEDLPKGDYEVQRIFICRSGCWVAPHHDETFQLLAFILSMNCKNRSYTLIGEIDPLTARPINWENVKQLKEQVDKLREEYKKQKEVKK
jgi:hypothetical protein